MQEAAKKRSFGEETVFTSFEAPPPRTVTIYQKQSMVLPRLETNIIFVLAPRFSLRRSLSKHPPGVCLLWGAKS